MSEPLLHELLLRLRLNAGLKQNELAKRMGYAPAHVSHIERGDESPGREYLKRFIHVMKLDEMESEQIWRLFDNRNLPNTRRAIDPSADLPKHVYYPLSEREEQIARIIALLTNPKGKPVVSISGPGGIGKTTLAHEIATRLVNSRQVANAFWVNTSGKQYIGTSAYQSDYALDLENIIEQIAAQLRMPEITRRALGEESQAMKYQLGRAVYLIVLDNLEETTNQVELVRTFINLLGRSRLLVTTRNRALDDIQLVQPFHVQGLNQDDSIAFVREEATRRGSTLFLEADVQTLRQVHNLTGGAPLALQRVISHTQTRSLEIALKYLRNAPETSDTDFYDQLYQRDWESLDPAARKLWLYIGRMIPTSVSQQHLRAMNVIDKDFDAVLQVLINRSLLDTHPSLTEAAKRLRLHPLARHFVQDLKRLRNEPEWIEYYERGCVRQAARAWLTITAQDTQILTLDDERANLIHCIHECVTRNEFEFVTAFWKQISTPLHDLGYWQEYEQLERLTLEAALTLKDRHLEGEIYSELGWLAMERGEHAAARELTHHAFDIFTALQDQYWKIVTQRYLATIALASGDFVSARNEFEKILAAIPDLAKDAPPEMHPMWQRQTDVSRDSLGNALRELGEYDAAEKELTFGLLGARTRGKVPYAISLLNLGKLRIKLAQLDEAEQLIRECLAICRAENAPEMAAGALHHLAEVMQLRGELATAREYANEAREIFERMGASASADKMRAFIETLKN